MNRTQFEHVIRAAAAITGAHELYVIGSQAVLATNANAPRELLQSMEVDLFTLRDPRDAALIEGSIGEGSPFHQTFGYHAHGVGPETAIVPNGWRERLIGVRSELTGGATAWCLERHDLAVAKLMAGREKDEAFVGVMFEHGMLDSAMMLQRLSQIDGHEAGLERASRMWARTASRTK